MPLTSQRLDALRLKADRRLVKTPPARVRDALVEITADELYSLTTAADVRQATVDERQAVEDLRVGAINSNSRPGHRVAICAPDLQLLVRLNTPAIEPPPAADPPAVLPMNPPPADLDEDEPAA